MKKFFNEFKAFINRGSVVDLAVGMIIGSAFTAIVTALVKGILTPLINWIPGADGTGALQTVLRKAVLDAEGNVVTEALILDWGSVISAIITFICTALVLFLIIKFVNKMKETGAKAKEAAEKIKHASDKSETSSEIAEEEAKETETPAEAPQTEETAQPTEEKETTEELLKQILAQLKENAKE